MRMLLGIAAVFAAVVPVEAVAQEPCPPGSPPSCNPEVGETPIDCEADHFQEGCEWWVNEHCGFYQMEGPSSANPDGIWELICIDNPHVGQIQYDLDCSCNRVTDLNGVWTTWFSGSVPNDVCTGVLFCTCVNGVFVGCTGVAPPQCQQFVARVCADDWDRDPENDGHGSSVTGDDFHDNPDFPECNGCHVVSSHPQVELSKLLREFWGGDEVRLQVGFVHDLGIE